jgi:FkbM family methyltransferase
MRKAWRRATLLSQRVLRQKTAGSSVGVLVRLWIWQIWRRTVRRPLLVRCAEGSLLLAPAWSRMASTVAATGMTERNDSLFVLDVLRPGDLFVDVGANIGYYTVLAAGRGANVEAFEPTEQTAAWIERSLRLNGRQAEVHRAACGAEPGVVHFTTGLDISNHIVSDGGVEVPLVTLDEELSGAQPELAVLKVDAEGHDIEVLRGALQVIERLRPVVLVEIWTGGHGPLGLLEPYGYRPYRYDTAAREVQEIPAGSKREGNLLLIADAKAEAIAGRLSSAQRPPLRAPSLRLAPSGVRHG